MKILVVLTLLLLFSNQALAQAWGGKERPANVILKPLEFQALETAFDTIGTAEAKKSVDLFPAIGDVVTAVNFKPGDFVQQGQVLVTLDDRRQKIAVDRARIELTDRTRTLKRLQQSMKSGAATQNEVDTALTQKDLARVALAEAQADLQDRTVLAPFSGFVGLTDIEPGDRISTDTLITTIDDRQQLFINFAAPEASIGMLTNDAEVLLEPWNERGVTINAKIAQLDSRISNTDRTLRVRALLDNSNDTYRPGLSFKVTLKIAGQRYPVIPEAALAWGATGAYVWVARDGLAAKEPVNIMQRQRGQILVDGELAEQESLVIEGIQRLRQGQKVKSGSLAQRPQTAPNGQG